MVNKIRLLPEIVANQIAAGEVVDRPASVVKEMMENSLDAGAQCVRVNYRNGGRDLIQIVDDGSGMSAVDARMAFDRHATSKIRSAEDIYALRTFGFRGEALASIAAVAQVEMRTRQADDEMGTRVEIHGGNFIGQSSVMTPAGTQFFVRNLFYNMPVRRSMLEKKTTSGSQIKSEFQRVALCYPEIEFELYANDALVYQLPATTLAGRIVDLVGRSIKQNLWEVEAETSIATIRGYIGRPAAAKRRNTEQFLFVNGRYFENNYLVSALMRAYEKLIPQTAQPSYFLFLEIDPSRIDVNIHPKKTEVRFADKEAVWQIVHAAVRETLAKSGAVPMMDFDRTTDVEIPVLRAGAIYGEPRAISREDYNPFSDSYIDPSAPDPNKDFRGFDVPYRDPESMQVNDFAVVEPRSRASFVPPVSTPQPTEKIPSQASWRDLLAPSEEFEEFLSGDQAVAEMPASEPTVGTMPSLTAEPSSEEESFIDFESGANQEAVQGVFEIASEPHFTAPMALGGGLALALLDGSPILIDLRRARERVLYEEYLAQLSGAEAVGQQLLFPEQLTLSNEEYRLMEEQEVVLAALGFDLRFGAEGRIEVHAMPANLSLDQLEGVLYELLQSFAEAVDTEQVQREKAARVLAVSGAKSTPKWLPVEQIEALLAQLLATRAYSFSPTGKQILAPLMVEELREKLG